MINNEVIWITGASSGIGLSLAEKLSLAGNKVIISSRNREELNRISTRYENITGVVCDVTNSSDLQQCADKIANEFTFIDRVIINAGNCEYFDIESPDWEMASRVMSVNFFGAINTFAKALPLLKKSNKSSPHIVVVASLASVVPFPRAEAYGASKAALQYFFESMRIDLANQNIAVTVVQPGFVKTPLTDKNDFPMPFMVSVDKASDVILKKMEKQPRIIQFPLRLAFLLRFMSCFSGLWNWLAINKLGRNQGLK